MPEVEEVKYHRKHPQIDLPIIYVKVTKGKPQNALKKAAKALSKEYRDALEELNV
jgi:DNA-directed RNA polymerase subunit L